VHPGFRPALVFAGASDTRSRYFRNIPTLPWGGISVAHIRDYRDLHLCLAKVHNQENGRATSQRPRACLRSALFL